MIMYFKTATYRRISIHQLSEFAYSGMPTTHCFVWFSFIAFFINHVKGTSKDVWIWCFALGIIWGIFDGEQINFTHIIDICVIFIGLYLINKQRANSQQIDVS